MFNVLHFPAQGGLNITKFLIHWGQGPVDFIAYDVSTPSINFFFGLFRLHDEGPVGARLRLAQWQSARPRCFGEVEHTV